MSVAFKVPFQGGISFVLSNPGCGHDTGHLTWLKPSLFSASCVDSKEAALSGEALPVEVPGWSSSGASWLTPPTGCLAGIIEVRSEIGSLTTFFNKDDTSAVSCSLSTADSSRQPLQTRLLGTGTMPKAQQVFLLGCWYCSGEEEACRLFLDFVLEWEQCLWLHSSEDPLSSPALDSWECECAGLKQIKAIHKRQSVVFGKNENSPNQWSPILGVEGLV